MRSTIELRARNRASDKPWIHFQNRACNSVISKLLSELDCVEAFSLYASVSWDSYRVLLKAAEKCETMFRDGKFAYSKLTALISHIDRISFQRTFPHFSFSLRFPFVITADYFYPQRRSVDPEVIMHHCSATLWILLSSAFRLFRVLYYFVMERVTSISRQRVCVVEFEHAVHARDSKNGKSLIWS